VRYAVVAQKILITLQAFRAAIKLFRLGTVGHKKFVPTTVLINKEQRIARTSFAPFSEPAEPSITTESFQNRDCMGLAVLSDHGHSEYFCSNTDHQNCI